MMMPFSERWMNYFMTLAYVAASQSKDKNTNIGAVIVNDRKIVTGMGFNSFPMGIDDNVPERQERPEKYFWMAHAERNALAFASETVGCSLFTNGMPCSDCMISTIQHGIKNIIIDANWDSSQTNNIKWVESAQRSYDMAKESGINVFKLVGFAPSNPLAKIKQSGNFYFKI